MPRMVPNRPFSFNNSEGEHEVFEALRLLPDDVYVFHSLRWVGKPSRGSRKAQGEADFVIFDPRRGILVVEVKSGIIELNGRRWFQTNRRTGVREEIQDPEQQASTSKFKLIDILTKQLRTEKCLLCHAVWFPSAPFSERLPPNLAAPIVLDRRSLDDVEAAICGAFDYWETQGLPRHRLSAAGRDSVIHTLAPTFSLAVSMRSDVEEIERQLVQLTSEQARILEFLEEQDEALIGGPAGTGKTLLAVQQAKALAAAGDRVLVVCFNAALQRHLAARFGAPRVTYATFNGLAKTLAPSAAEDYLAAALGLLMDEDVEVDFDHVLVDEGQDFEDDWLDALRIRQQMRPERRLAAEVPRFLVFYDPRQLIQRRRLPSWIRDAECRLVLRRNCRNTKQIGKTVGRIGALERYHLSDADGARPVLHIASGRPAQLEALSSVLRTLLAERGLRLDEVAIVTLETLTTSLLAGRSEVAGYQLSETAIPGSLLFTTVRKFKGLEAKAVVLIDVDLAPGHDAAWRNRLYVGASRATHELHLLAEPCANSEIQAFVAELFPGRKIRSTLQAIARQLNVTMEKSC